MKVNMRFGMRMLGLAVLTLLATTHADSQADKLSPYEQIAKVNVPSGFAFPGGGFDIVWADSSADRVYIADRGNSSASPTVPPGVDVFSTKHPEFLFEIPLTQSGGTNGVLVFHKPDEEKNGGTLVVGGTDSNTYFVDLSRPFATPTAVSTGGKARADELGYDPKDQIILIANPDEASANPTAGVPFITFISTDTTTPTILGKIIYDGTAGPGHGPAATGIEQPVWDGLTGKFYLTIPKATTSPTTSHLSVSPNGEIDEINPTTRTITRSFATTCSPAGLALIPGQRLITSCGDVVDISSFTLVTTVTGIGPADEIWYNSGDERVYFGGIFGSPVVNGVANSTAPLYSVIATLPWTGHFTPAPAQFSHSIAADSVYNHSFVPVSNVGVLVFTDDHDYGNGQNGQ